MILSRRSENPTLCFVCQGQAVAVGVSKIDAKGYHVPPFNGWVCMDCVPTARKVIDMRPDNVSLIESKAIDAVAKATLDDGIQTFIGALFDAGVDKLSEATPEQIDMAKERLIVNGDAPAFVKTIVIGFGDEVKASVERGDPPF